MAKRNDMNKVSKTLIGGFALVGLNRLYESLTIRGWGRYINRLEQDVEYDDMQFCKDGEPLFLVDPSYTSTIFFVDGFRIRPAVGMNREWLTAMHHDLKVNIVAPIIGLQSMPYWLRSKEWSYIEEVRQAIQIYDAYVAAREAEHKMVPVAFSYGSVAVMTIAAKRNPAEVVLISPLPAQLALPEQQIDRLPTWIRELARTVLGAALSEDGYFRGRRWGWIQYILPIYIRPGKASGGWDVADRACRAEVNARIHNGQELRLRDLLELDDAMRFMRFDLLPDIAGSNITLLSGRKDSIMTHETTDLFASQLRELGSNVEHLIYERSAHNLLLDCEAEQVMRDVAERVIRARSKATSESQAVLDLTDSAIEPASSLG